MSQYPVMASHVDRLVFDDAGTASMIINHPDQGRAKVPPWELPMVGEDLTEEAKAHLRDRIENLLSPSPAHRAQKFAV